MDDGERDASAASIAARVADYRTGQIPGVTAASVLAWWQQFDERDRPAVLRETARLLRATYVSNAKILAAIGRIAAAPRGGSDFWRTVGFLRIQERGSSQIQMLADLEAVLTERFGLSTENEVSEANAYLYIDDVLFTGNRVRYDLTRWLNENNIRNAEVHVVTIVAYSQGLGYARHHLEPLFAARNSVVRFSQTKKLENRLDYARDSEVFWPTNLPDDERVNAWRETFEGQAHFSPRPPGGRGSTTLFSSEASREIIEQAFLRKGAHIYSLSENPNASMRPLGFAPIRTPGFGATVITARNCPNNAPLAMWWGDPNSCGPLSRWRPLLPRRVGVDNRGADDYGF